MDYEKKEPVAEDYVCIKALQGGAVVIGMTRGSETRLLHTERMEAGEVMLLQFTQHTSAVKIRGHAVIYTKHGIIKTDDQTQ